VAVCSGAGLHNAAENQQAVRPVESLNRDTASCNPFRERLSFDQFQHQSLRCLGLLYSVNRAIFGWLRLAKEAEAIATQIPAIGYRARREIHWRRWISFAKGNER